jgi:2-keto-4-pentenoate hydratase/2-oxohepta-3-ene-1,7-dioic acid hydratase in catechol pathway
MRLARIRTDGGVECGEYEGPRDGPYEAGKVVTEDGEYRVGEDGDLLAPCRPSALYCVGRNYAATIERMDYERPEQPDWFIKPPASLHPPGRPVEYPGWTDELTYAGELAAVIDDRCSDLQESEVDDHVRGYTILNDLDALDQPGRTARKAFDGSGPLGPWIETDLEPSALEMHTDVGGERRQSASTDAMLFSPRTVIAFLSERYTFRPGDVVAFGSPDNPGLVEPGEAVEIYYEGIGTLRNRLAPE